MRSMLSRRSSVSRFIGFFAMPDQQNADFFASLGRATSAWQKIEIALAHVFIVAIQSPQISRVLAAFDTIQTFRDKLGVVDVVVRQGLKTECFISEWNALNNKLNRLAKRRNRIAHAHVVQIQMGDQSQLFASPPLSKVPPGVFLNEAERQKILRNQHQIRLLERAFTLAAKRVWAFLDAARHELGAPPAK